MALRWGIAGAGKISNDFVKAVQFLPSTNHQVTAVASRTKKSADDFAAKLNIPTVHETFEQLAQDAKVDVVYIGVLNPQHYEVTKLMLNNGKHVLCEKPFTMNEKQTTELLQLSKQKKLFLMEAVWSRCFPVYKELERIIKSGEIGDVYHASVEFGFPLQQVDRLTQKDMGGGAILDLGVYILQFQQFVFRGSTPTKVLAAGHLNKYGTDQSVSAILTYPEGKTATVTATAMVEAPCEGIVVGTKGNVRIPQFWCPSKLILNGKTLDFPLQDNEGPFFYKNSQGLAYEADEVRECIKSGKLESDRLPHAETLQLSQLMDNLRKQLGVVFETDK